MLVPTVRMSFDVINECLDKDDDQYKSNKAETEDCELRVCGQYGGYFLILFLWTIPPPDYFSSGTSAVAAGS